MNTIDYKKHDEIYNFLKENGYKGWGGKSFDSRHIGYKEDLKRIINYWGNKRGDVLELGSGTGDRLFHFEQQGFDVTGFEISSTAIRWANEKSIIHKSGAKFFNYDVAQPISSINTKFDIIIDGNCAHCIAEQDRKYFFNNINKLLKDEGIFYLSSITSEIKKGFILDKNVSPVERYYASKDMLINELFDYGFKIEKSWFATRKHNDHFAAILKKESKTT